MRFIVTAFQLSLLTVAVAHPADTSPFSLAFPNEAETPYGSNDTLTKLKPAADPAPGSFYLFRRQNCPANYNSCSALAAAAAGSCCSKDSVCSRDNAGNVACCPIGSLCTGTIGSPVVASPAGVVTTPATTTTIAPDTITSTASYVPNPYFAYPYILSTFANSAACASAYAGCASDYALCTANLQGAAPGYAVTIVAPGGGITVSVPAATNVGLANATSICSSLSSVACPGTPATCAAGTGTGGLIIVGGAQRIRGEGRWWVGLLISLLVGVVGRLL